MSLIQKIFRIPIISAILKHRFIKFGSVGSSGTLVNLAVLYIGQEYLFLTVADEQQRLNLSLPLAIMCATVNNFTWNRLWTWRDRKPLTHKPVLLQLMQYFIASWVSILLQFVLTKLFAYYFHYIIANVTAIVLAAIIGFLIHDVWAFGIGKQSSSAQDNT